MRPKLKSRVVSDEQLFVVLLACILFLGATILTSEDAVRMVLAGSAVCAFMAIAGCWLLYFHPEMFRKENSLERLVRRFHGENTQQTSDVTREDLISTSDCPMSEKRQNRSLWHESPFDAAVTRIVRGIERDLGVRR